MKLTEEIIELIRRADPKRIAEELASVQPIDPKAFLDLYELMKANPNCELVFVPNKNQPEAFND